MGKYDHIITHDEIQNLEYEILKTFDVFCKEHNLKYFLCGGTLLGAIRHKGFIPWDDDIDVCMLREDYDKLHKLVKNNRRLKTNPNYRFILPLDENYEYPFTKLVDDQTIVYEKNIDKKFSVGVWVDIFPMDSWPENVTDRKKLMKKHNKYKFFNKIYIAGNYATVKEKILGRIGKFIYFFICHNKTSQYWVDHMIRLVPQEESQKVGNVVWPYKDGDVFDRDVFSKALPCLFVDQEFPIPVGYEQYLTNMYGDYMQIPKPEDRVIHDFEGYVIKK